MVYIYNGILFNYLKKGEILPLVTTWMDFEGILLSQRKTNAVRSHFFLMLNQKKKKTEKETRFVVTRGRGWDDGRGNLDEGG